MAAFLVYAAGPIRGATYDEAEGWREKAARWLAPYDIHVVSPMRGKDYLKTVGLLGGPSGTGGAPESVVANEKAIFRRDRWDVERSDLVLANFEETPVFPNLSLGGNEVQISSLGTAMEIAWADAFRVPVVAVIPKGNVHDHPLIRHGCMMVVETLDEALTWIPVMLGAAYDMPFVNVDRAVG